MWYTGAVLCGREINVGSLFPLYPEKRRACFKSQRRDDDVDQMDGLRPPGGVVWATLVLSIKTGCVGKNLMSRWGPAMHPKCSRPPFKQDEQQSVQEQGRWGESREREREETERNGEERRYTRVELIV